MKKLTETDVKYLAGLIDADGWGRIQFQKSISTGKTYIKFQIGVGCSESIDRDGQFINWLSSFGGSVSVQELNGKNFNTWSLQKKSELNMFLPRIIKHQIIKAKHFKRMFDIYSEYRGMALSEKDIISIKNTLSGSRLDTGPLKPKNYPSKAWTSGYLDGDGHYGLHSSKKRSSKLGIDVLSTERDSTGLQLLLKTYGGNISYSSGHPRWYRGLGKQHKQFAIQFLKTMHRHSRLKKWKIEQMLAFHNSSATTK